MLKFCVPCGAMFNESEEHPKGKCVCCYQLAKYGKIFKPGLISKQCNKCGKAFLGIINNKTQSTCNDCYKKTTRHNVLMMKEKSRVERGLA